MQWLMAESLKWTVMPEGEVVLCNAALIALLEGVDIPIGIGSVMCR